ncbi:MAG: hypothetical protein CSA97_03105 [Bacteroidetes bacterium]|nr:MAG: hypothetical protein CSA97_03105 [Bacteroidota bacterium]
MARITPVRPKYWPKSEPVVYVVADKEYIRARAENIRNPRTKRQQENRSRMAVASHFLAQMQPMATRGFQPTMTNRPGWESRRVGGYHVALGVLLKRGMQKGKDGWEIDYQNVKLSDGNSLDMYPMGAQRHGREMSISFPKGLPKGAKRVRMAIHSAGKGRTLHVSFDAPRQREMVKISVPKWAAGGKLHLYYTVEVSGKSRWASGYVHLAAGRSPGRFRMSNETGAGRNTPPAGQPSSNEPTRPRGHSPGDAGAG